MKHSKKIDIAAKQFIKEGEEQAQAMLDSIGAIHGQRAQMAVQRAFDAIVVYLSMADLFCNQTEGLPDDTKQLMVQAVVCEMQEMSRVLFHFAVGADVPVCSSECCNCHPQVKEMDRMLNAMIGVHIEGKERLANKINAVLGK